MNSPGKRVSDKRPDDTNPRSGLGDTTENVETPDVKLDAVGQALIGQQLRAIYEEIRQQQIPEHLLRLLDELERKERQA